MHKITVFSGAEFFRKIEKFVEQGEMDEWHMAHTDDNAEIVLDWIDSSSRTLFSCNWTTPTANIS